MRDVLYADLVAAMKERGDGVAVLLDAATPAGSALRLETWRVGDAAWWVWVYPDGRAFVYEHLDDPVGVVARLKGPGIGGQGPGSEEASGAVGGGGGPPALQQTAKDPAS